MKQLISGKVRDVYEASDRELLIVTSDRISAFDVVLDSVIPGKGAALNRISAEWFRLTQSIVPNHMISVGLADCPAGLAADPARWEGRVMLVRRLRMLPYEFIVRGYMFGSLWKEYSRAGTYRGEPLPPGYRLAEKLAEPMLTPARKNGEGHDEPMSMGELRAELGSAEADRIRGIALDLYRACGRRALARGIIIADTKFEFGYDENGALTLGDELLTPDSSRFWAAEDYRIGISPRSYDKQPVRDWLTARGLAGVKPAPRLPEDVVRRTADIYEECARRLTE